MLIAARVSQGAFGALLTALGAISLAAVVALLGQHTTVYTGAAATLGGVSGMALSSLAAAALALLSAALVVRFPRPGGTS